MGGESGGGDAGGNEGFAEVGVGGPDGVDWVGQCMVVIGGDGGLRRRKWRECVKKSKGGWWDIMCVRITATI
ncbi:hypothetical protein Tco_0284790 [Tanacetum coccineum]